jgi:hypothetical protein
MTEKEVMGNEKKENETKKETLVQSVHVITYLLKFGSHHSNLLLVGFFSLLSLSCSFTCCQSL